MATEVTAGHREHLADEPHLDRILPALDSGARGSISTSGVGNTSRKCEINACRLNLSCYRDSQFYIATEVQGAIGVYACTSHVGQAVVAATVNSGRTSVLVMSLVKHPRPPAT